MVSWQWEASLAYEGEGGIRRHHYKSSGECGSLKFLNLNPRSLRASSALWTLTLAHDLLGLWIQPLL